MAANCQNGHPVEDTAKFCPECGAPLAPPGETTKELPALSEDTPVSAAASEPEPPPVKARAVPQPLKRKRPRTRTIVISAVVLFLLVSASFALLGVGTGTQSTTTLQAQAAKPPKPKPKPKPPPTRYQQLLPASLTIHRAAAPLCGQYRRTITTWEQADQARTAALAGSSKDMYAAWDFVHSSGHGWVRAQTAAAYEQGIVGVAQRRLRVLAGAHASQITDPMIDLFRRDTLVACKLADSYRADDGKLQKLDTATRNVISLAALKPWYPAGYNAYPDDDNVAWEWDNSVTKCSGAGIDGEYCWGMRVVTRDGCPSSLYAEINVLQGQVVIDFTNATLGSLAPGQVGELAFDAIEQTSGTLQGQLKTINCY